MIKSMAAVINFFFLDPISISRRKSFVLIVAATLLCVVIQQYYQQTQSTPVINLEVYFLWVWVLRHIFYQNIEKINKKILFRQQELKISINLIKWQIFYLFHQNVSKIFSVYYYDPYFLFKYFKYKNHKKSVQLSKDMQRFFSSHSLFSTYKNYSKLSISPFQNSPPSSNPEHLHKKVAQIFDWAKQNKAQYYSFLAFPHTGAIAEKQQAFISLSYEKNISESGSQSQNYNGLVRNIASEKLKLSDLLKGEADGSSFPNGGLRHTHQARGYFIWDWKSDIFIKKSNKVMYIPALLVNHHGQALDDKTTFRKAQNLIQKQCTQLLNQLNIKSRGIFIGLGLQQEFFIIPKSQYHSRLDLTQTSRALFQLLPPNNQQLSKHYYAKLQPKIESLLTESESCLLQLGIPIKTRHKEVAPNQYQFCSIFQDAGKAIDHNLIKMMILEQVADKHDLKILWHQKPFVGINGSGKHMNWSLNYWDQKGKMRGLFGRGSVSQEVYMLFILIKLKAILSNQELYMSTISVPGNELRLGGHQAPPRIFSTFLGQTLTSLLQNQQPKALTNLKQKIEHLICNIHQQDTDRNRTSPYAYTSNRYQFRAVGSSQNCFYPMTVILTTIAKEIREVTAKLKNGQKLPEIIEQLIKDTARVRFQGDGYSSKWIEEAKGRGLHVNDSFSQNISNIGKYGNILVNMGVYTQNQLKSKSNVCQQNYIKTVLIQCRTMLLMLNKNIIPRLYSLLVILPRNSTSQIILKRSKKIEELTQKIIGEAQYLEKYLKDQEIGHGHGHHKNKETGLKDAEKLRNRLGKISKIVQEALVYVKDDKNLPQTYDFFGTL